jgi:hypothetical protein
MKRRVRCPLPARGFLLAALVFGAACTVEAPEDEASTVRLSIEALDASIGEGRIRLVGGPLAAHPPGAVVVAYPLQTTAMVERSEGGLVAEDGSFSLTTAAIGEVEGARRVRLTLETATALSTVPYDVTVTADGVAAAARPPDCFSVVPRIVNVGLVRVHDVAARAVQMVNGCSGPVEVVVPEESITLPPWTVVVSPLAVVPPGDSRTIVVGYAPASPETRESVIAIDVQVEATTTREFLTLRAQTI